MFVWCARMESHAPDAGTTHQARRTYTLRPLFEPHASIHSSNLIKVYYYYIIQYIYGYINIVYVKFCIIICS